MAQKGIIGIRFPVGGIDRSKAYRQQSPFTTPDCCNVRPSCSLLDRERGGSRPGLAKSFSDQLGSGYPIRMLSMVDIVKTDNTETWQDLFEGTNISGLWTTAPWLTFQEPNSDWGFYTDDSFNGDTATFAAYLGASLSAHVKDFGEADPQFICVHEAVPSSYASIRALKDIDLIVTKIKYSNNITAAMRDDYNFWGGGNCSDLTAIGLFYINFTIAGGTLWLSVNGAAAVDTSVASTGALDIRLTYTWLTGVTAVYYRSNAASSWTSAYSAVKVTERGYLMFAVAKPNFGGTTRTASVQGYEFVTDDASRTNYFDPQTSDDLTNPVYNEKTGAYSDAIPIKAASDYYVEMLCVPDKGKFGGTYSIFLRMGDTKPDCQTNGVQVDLTMRDSLGTYEGNLRVFASGSETTYPLTGATSGVSEAGWLRVGVSANTISVWWKGTSIITPQAISAPAGARVGFGLECIETDAACLADEFRVNYVDSATTTKERVRSLVCASSNGYLYVESNPTRFGSAVSSYSTLASDRQISAAKHLQKLYIADNGPVVLEFSDGVIASNGVDLTSATVGSHWDAYGLSQYDHVVTLSGLTPATYDGVYYISGTPIAAKLTLTVSTGGAHSGVHFRIERGPKVYDPAAGTLALMVADTGNVPVGCPLICTYRDRLCWAAATNAPHVWYMSRQGDALDYDYGADADDYGRAVAGLDSEAGQIGEPILGQFPFNDDFLIWGCSNSLWVLRGDPAFGGSINNVSRDVGIVGRGAACFGPAGEFVFLSREGLYLTAPGLVTPPSAWSKTLMPQELLDVTTDNQEVSMAYDVREGGIQLYITPTQKPSIDPGYSNRIHWWFDWGGKSAWPVQLRALHEPLVVYQYQSNRVPEESDILLGCMDGYVRHFRDIYDTDDGYEIVSYMDIGPVPLSGSDYGAGLLSEIIATLAENSGDVNWHLYVGDSAEATFDNTTEFASGIWSADLNYKNRPRARGTAFRLRLENGDTKRWAVETINGVITTAGKQRKL